MTKTNANTGKFTGMAKNTARVYGTAKKTLGQRFKDYMHEVVVFYGDLYEKTGYRTFIRF